METKTVNFRFLQEKEACELIADGIKNKNEKLQFFGDYSGHILDAVSFIIQTFYQGGEINVKYMVDACAAAARIRDMFAFFTHLIRTNLDWYERQGIVFGPMADDVKPGVFAIGELLEDYDDSDPDPYQTAGGYRSWKALKGTRVEYSLNRDLSVSACFESNCLVDHYNNNICGVSTGGGTTNYKPGERVAKRSAQLGREFLDSGWKKTEFKAKVLAIDAEKALKMCGEYHPEFIGAIR